jgi:hypothetical protein
MAKYISRLAGMTATFVARHSDWPAGKIERLQQAESTGLNAIGSSSIYMAGHAILILERNADGVRRKPIH